MGRKFLLLQMLLAIWGLPATSADCPCGLQVTDIDGNVYATVVVGNQCWTAQNLKVTRYADGTSIQGTHVYLSDTSLLATYGRMYEWEAAVRSEGASLDTSSPVQGVCPDGWHIPALDEWQTLVALLGGEGLACGPIKEQGTAHWAPPNVGATNSSGFGALPGGDYEYGEFHVLGECANFWSSTPSGSADAWTFACFYDRSSVYISVNPISFAYSIRCVCDNAASVKPQRRSHSTRGEAGGLLLMLPRRVTLGSALHRGLRVCAVDIRGRALVDASVRELGPVLDLRKRGAGVAVVRFATSE